MFDKRLFKELKIMKFYWIKVTAANLAAVTLTIFQASFLANIINEIFINKKNIGEITKIIVALILIIILRCILGFGMDLYNRQTSIKIKANLRNNLINAFIKKGPIKLKDEKPGEIVTLVQDGVEGMEAYFSEFIPQISLVSVWVPIIFIVVVSKDWISGLIMLFTVPLIPIFMMLIGRLADKLNKKQWKSLQSMGGHFLDVLRGLPTLKLFGRSKRQAEIVEEISEDYRKATVKVLKVAFLSALVLELIATLSTALISVSLGIRLLYSMLNFKSAFFVLLLTPDYYQSMRQLGAKFHSAMSSVSIADDVYLILSEKITEPLSIAHKDVLKNIKISINNLGFSYVEDQSVLKNFSMEIPFGKRISLVGPSGSGKSTIISLIMGFINGYSGSIKVNDIELNEISKESWINSFAYVPQNPKIFKASVLENLAMARPNASYEEIINIAKLTGVNSFVEDLPQGYNSIIGDGGISLSGGEIQLISIARACLKDVEFVLLDEPTSALDPETERKVNAAIAILVGGKTSLTIAHRIPTIINSDKIYVLENGSIVEEGTHEQLIKLKSNYYNLLNVWGDIHEPN
ncbi:MAG: thiol reductant ABC exporter subunit CydD [Clostridiaceae bacterium]|nr:thiol reductant ABC exporter subunit CydD [Clostridiaceae bacterium]